LEAEEVCRDGARPVGRAPSAFMAWGVLANL
jgi:hypothetical protein